MSQISKVDPITRRQFWEMIYETAHQGLTVFITRHYMDEAEYCNRLKAGIAYGYIQKIVQHVYSPVFILLSGLFTPIESMPTWAQKITWFNPVAWFIKVIRMVLLKGSGWNDVQPYFLIISIFAIFTNAIAVLAYKKRA
ncbi:MAG: ABC transporter permease [Thermoflavifilum sp.]|nr:ABC transporter permease [Thermoflavifilum sp.]